MESRSRRERDRDPRGESRETSARKQGCIGETTRHPVGIPNDFANWRGLIEVVSSPWRLRVGGMVLVPLSPGSLLLTSAQAAIRENLSSPHLDVYFHRSEISSIIRYLFLRALLRALLLSIYHSRLYLSLAIFMWAVAAFNYEACL